MLRKKKSIIFILIKHLTSFTNQLNQQQSLSESEVKEDDNETENTSGVPHNLDAKKKKKKRKRKTGRQISTKRSSEDNADVSY
jgi:hypothetical protein